MRGADEGAEGRVGAEPERFSWPLYVGHPRQMPDSGEITHSLHIFT